MEESDKFRSLQSHSFMMTVWVLHFTCNAYLSHGGPTSLDYHLLFFDWYIGLYLPSY